MKKTLIVLVLLISSIITANAQTACNKTKTFKHADGQAQAFGRDFYFRKCACLRGVTKQGEKEALAFMKLARDNYVQFGGKASDLGSMPTSCKINGANSSSTSKSGAKTSSVQQKSTYQLEMEKRFRNYSNSMSLKRQGEAIANAFANQVKKFGELGHAQNPQELLNNFNNNMAQISRLQTQNRAENLNQIENTVNSALNQLNSGNVEGAMLNTLSLIDQQSAQKEAQREAERQKARLVAQHQQKMSNFYWKAVDLNNQAIDNYYKNAAYAFSKTDELYNLEYVKHHECFARHMKQNFSYSNPYWTKNICTQPIKRSQIENNLVAKYVQYINAAKRKYKLFEETGVEQFRESAMRFAGTAAHTKGSAEYYYLVGHYAGVDNSIVAYTSFETAKAYSSRYFYRSPLKEEYNLVKQAVQRTFKDAIDSNNHDVVRKIIGSNLHKAIKIDGQPSMIYAIKIDQPEVVQLFLNDYAKGKSQKSINYKVNETIMMASMLDAYKTIQYFIELGFSVDFKVRNEIPFRAAKKSYATNAMYVIAFNSKRKTKYLLEIINMASKEEDVIVLRKILNDEISEGTKTVVSKILSDLDEKYYNNAILLNQKEWYYMYRAKFPNGKHISEINNKIYEIEEKELYLQVKDVQTVISAEAFIAKYPNSVYKEEIQLLLFDKLYEKGNNAYHNSKKHAAKREYEKCLKLKKDIYSKRSQEIEKIEFNLSSLYDYGSIHFFIDTRGSIGFGNVFLNGQKSGWYWMPSFNLPLFGMVLKDQSDAEINNNNKIGSSYNDDNFLLIKKSGNIKRGMAFSMPIGITHHIYGPIWGSVGIGFGIYRQYDEITFIEEDYYGYFNPEDMVTEYVFNDYESKIKLYLEAGVYIRVLEKSFIKTGIAFQKGAVFQFGFVHTLYVY